MVQIFDGSAGFINNPANFFGLGVGSTPWLSFGQVPLPGSGSPPVELARGAGTATVESDFLGTGNQAGYAGYLNVAIDPINRTTSLVNPNFPELDPTAGFRVDFSARVQGEDSEDNRSGFSFIVLGNDARGVEISFEGKTDGDSSDDFLFAQQPEFNSETAERTTPGLFDITQTQNYSLTILGETYTLAVNNVERLSGTVKEYVFDPAIAEPPLLVNPYRIENLLFFGDDTDTGTSIYTLGAIDVTLLGAPTATGVGISGTLEVGQTVTGNHTYSDPNGDAESGTTFQWFRADDSAGSGRVAIAGATTNTYTTTSDDQGKFLLFEVTPRDQGGQVGVPVLSSATASRIATASPISPVSPAVPAIVPPPPPLPTAASSPSSIPTATITLVDSAQRDINDGQPTPVPLAPWSLPGSRHVFEIANPGTTSLTVDDLILLQAPTDGAPAPLTISPLSANPIPPGAVATFEITVSDTLSPGTYVGNAIAQFGGDFFNFSVEATVVDIPPTPIASDPLSSLLPLTEVSGTPEADELIGGPGSQLVRGFQGNDVLLGNGDADLLTSGAGDDSLFGGQGDDWLFGREGNDFLAGDRGNDSLVGGPGADTFLLGENLEVDTILGFEDGGDRLQLAGNLTFADLTITDGLGFASISITSTSETVAQVFGTFANQLTALDFS